MRKRERRAGVTIRFAARGDKDSRSPEREGQIARPTALGGNRSRFYPCVTGFGRDPELESSNLT